MAQTEHYKNINDTSRGFRNLSVDKPNQHEPNRRYGNRDKGQTFETEDYRGRENRCRSTHDIPRRGQRSAVCHL